MAISTYKTYLMYKDGDAYKKLTDISAFPDLGGDPDTIDVTSLSDGMRKFIGGIKSSDALSFDSFYTKEEYARLDALRGKQTDLAVWFGAAETDGEGTPIPDGSLGKFEFTGEIFVRVGGAGVNAAVPMTITIVPSTEIKFVDD